MQPNVRSHPAHTTPSCPLPTCRACQPYSPCSPIRTLCPRTKLTPSTENLDKTKVTGISQVDNLQDGVNGLVSGQVGQGGLLQPVGDSLSKEGINRAERGGKDENGKSIESQGPLGGYGQGAVDGVKGAGSGVAGAGKSAGGYLGGMWGGKKEGEEKK